MKISQAEARRLRREVARLTELEHKRGQAFASEYPGVWICEEEPVGINLAAVKTARKLGFAVAVQTHNDKFQFFAVPLEVK